MTDTPSHTAESDPTGRLAVRIWLGLLLACQLLTLMGAIGWAYGGWHLADPDASADVAVSWHRSVVAAGSALLMMTFAVSGVGLILDLAWSWRAVLVAALLQVAFTLATQVWEALVTKAPEGFPSGRAALGTLVGSILWSVIPVAILVLAALGRRRPAERKVA